MSVALADSFLANFGVDIEHHFGGGAYIKATTIPAGVTLGQHDHDHDHLSVLVSGSVTLKIDEDETEVDGFQVLKLEAGKRHSVTAKTDVVWLCVWSADETNEQEIDKTILGE